MRLDIRARMLYILDIRVMSIADGLKLWEQHRRGRVERLVQNFAVRTLPLCSLERSIGPFAISNRLLADLGGP